MSLRKQEKWVLKYQKDPSRLSKIFLRKTSKFLDVERNKIIQIKFHLEKLVDLMATKNLDLHLSKYIVSPGIKSKLKRVFDLSSKSVKIYDDKTC